MSQQAQKGSPLHDLTAFQRDLMFLLKNSDENEPHGLHLKEELEQFYQTKIHHGRLYPNLDDLVDMGLVQKSSVDGRTNSYSITRRGRRELESHQAFFNGNY